MTGEERHSQAPDVDTDRCLPIALRSSSEEVEKIPEDRKCREC